MPHVRPGRLTLLRAALLAVLMLWVLEWVGWNYPPGPGLHQWAMVAARSVLFVTLGGFAAHWGRRWSAPLVPAGAFLVAFVVVMIIGALTGRLMERGVGPAFALAFLVTGMAYALVAGAVGAAGYRLARKTLRRGSAEA